eukprot:g11484.t1
MEEGDTRIYTCMTQKCFGISRGPAQCPVCQGPMQTKDSMYDPDGYVPTTLWRQGNIHSTCKRNVTVSAVYWQSPRLMQEFLLAWVRSG